MKELPAELSFLCFPDLPPLFLLLSRKMVCMTMNTSTPIAKIPTPIASLLNWKAPKSPFKNCTIIIAALALKYTEKGRQCYILFTKGLKRGGERMKAAVIHKYGKPGVFQIGEMPEPVPQRDEVQISVKASSVNPIDYKTRSGSIFFLSGWKFPRVLGSDFSGVITACGPETGPWQVGDQVYGFSPGATKGGAYGEIMCCQASRVAMKPDPLSDEEAAAIPLAGLTAYQALYKEGGLQQGMNVLVIGATGGVGHFAVQIAKAAGCQVTGVCHSRNGALAIEIGCDEVLPYDVADFRANGKKYDLILDAAGKSGYFSCRRSLESAGSYVTTIPYPSTMLIHWFTRTSAGRKGRFVSALSTTQELEILGKLSRDGLLKPHIEAVFGLEEIAEAHTQSEAGNSRGKIVIRIQP
jgi:NADPH:quinone reductase-like Zn-dependent oxidoreductase